MSPPTLAHLARLRASAGKSQRSLAKACGVSYNVIRRLEAGGTANNVTIGQLDRIATELSCSLADLLEPSNEIQATESRRELSIAEARLLRRIHRGDNVSNTLSHPERQFHLPALIRTGLISMVNGRPELSSAVRLSLDP
jgi:transcriptional regulator with XRE-family HTH domain